METSQVPRSVGPVRLLLIQGTPFCNIDCKYCYLPDRSNKSRATIELIQRAAVRLKTEGLVQDNLRICWHAGEPLASPIEEMRSSVEAFSDIFEDTEIELSVQTNGTLINDDWCNFFIDNSFSVGVSIDGPKEFHDLYRVDRRGRGTHDSVLQGINRLKQHNIPVHALAVLSAESMRHPDLLFNYFQELNVSSVCFNIEETEGPNISNALNQEDSYQVSLNFFIRYFDLIRRTPNAHWMREYSYSLRRLCSVKKVSHAEVQPFETLTIDYLGNYYTYSPELAGAKTMRYPRGFALGNIFDREISFRTALLSRSDLLLDIQAGVKKCESECRYFPVCGGGAGSNKVFENGSLATSETRHCRLTLQAQSNAILHVLTDAARQAAKDS